MSLDFQNYFCSYVRTQISKFLRNKSNMLKRKYNQRLKKEISDYKSAKNLMLRRLKSKYEYHITTQHVTLFLFSITGKHSRLFLIEINPFYRCHPLNRDEQSTLSATTVTEDRTRFKNNRCVSGFEISSVSDTAIGYLFFATCCKIQV